MKRLLTLILVLTFLVVTGTLVSADGKTRLKENVISKQLRLDTFRQTVSN
jgi:hypothetical protein